MPEIVYLSLGSNLGNREANLAGAITALGTYSEISAIRSASFYETAPLKKENQPPFLNTVVELKTNYNPFQLFDVTRRIETLLGRPKNREKNMPRTMDIDILCHGNAYLETEELIIPHPELPNRRFVLVPFCELAPDFIVPKWNRSTCALLSICPDKSQVRKHIIESSA